MKLLIVTCFCFMSFAFFAQNFKVNDEVNYFDGLNWIESQIVKVGDNGTYLIYTNREKTKTKWCKAEDLEPMYKESTEVTQTTVHMVETHYQYVFHPTDIVKYLNQMDKIYVITEVVSLKNEGMVEIYMDSTKTRTFDIHEKNLEIIQSKFPAEYRSSEIKVDYTYKVGEEVDYMENNNWFRGVITKINDEGKVMIDGKWLDSASLRKKR